MIKYLNKFLDMLYIAIKAFVAILITLSITLAFVEIIRRYFFGAVFSWSDEFIRYCLVYVGLVGSAAAYREGQLVFFDSFLNHIPENLRSVIAYLSDAISLACMCICLYLSIRTIRQPSVLKGISPSLRIPMTVPYLAFVFGFILLIIFCLGGMINRISGYNTSDKEKEVQS